MMILVNLWRHKTEHASWWGVMASLTFFWRNDYLWLSVICCWLHRIFLLSYPVSDQGTGESYIPHIYTHICPHHLMNQAAQTVKVSHVLHPLAKWYLPICVFVDITGKGNGKGKRLHVPRVSPAHHGVQALYTLSHCSHYAILLHLSDFDVVQCKKERGRWGRVEAIMSLCHWWMIMLYISWMW